MWVSFRSFSALRGGFWHRLFDYGNFKLIQNYFYVYWTVHHLDSWIKRDQLDVTCFIISLFTAQHISDVNTSILRSLRLIWWFISWVVLLWFDVCWCYVVVWLGWCGIRMQAEALQCFSLQPAKVEVDWWVLVKPGIPSQEVYLF